MIFKAVKAGLFFCVVAASLPADSKGSMPGLAPDAPQRFSAFAQSALAKISGSANEFCKNEDALCEQASQAKEQLAQSALELEQSAKNKAAELVLQNVMEKQGGR